MRIYQDTGKQEGRKRIIKDGQNIKNFYLLYFHSYIILIESVSTYAVESVVLDFIPVMFQLKFFLFQNIQLSQ